jgi:hypothetical protein
MLLLVIAIVEGDKLGSANLTVGEEVSINSIVEQTVHEL